MNPDDQTLRDRLLARHAHATPQLDALRRAALPAPSITWVELLRALFLPHRRVWQTLAAVWIGLLALYLSHPRSTPVVDSARSAAVAAWFAQLKSHDTLAQIDRHP